MTEPLDSYRDMAAVRDQGNLQRLDVDACLELLTSHHVGRVAVNDHGGPVVFPVNYVVDGGTVVFRTGMGSKLAATDERAHASFQVDGFDLDVGTGWSVLVRGRLVEVVAGDEVDRLATLPLVPLAGGDRHHFVRVEPRAVTGRRIALPDHVPAAWLAPTDAPDWANDPIFRPGGSDPTAWSTWT